MSWDCVYILSADLSSEFPPVASAYLPAQSASFAYSASLQRDLDDERAPFSELLFYFTYYSEEHNYYVTGSTCSSYKAKYYRERAAALLCYFPKLDSRLLG